MARTERPGLVAGLPPREAFERAADELAQQAAGATAHNIGSFAPGYIHAVHPDHGEPVTFTPGELLPEWVVALWRAQPEPPEQDELGVYRLQQPAPTAKPAAKAATRRRGARR